MAVPAANPREVVRQFLIDQGLGVANDSSPPPPKDNSVWPVSAGPLPKDQGEFSDNWVSVQTNGAVNGGRNFRDGDRNAYPQVTIIVRSFDEFVGEYRGRQIEGALDLIGVDPARNDAGVGLGPVDVHVGRTDEDFTILSALVTVPTTKIGQEDFRDRPIFTLNARLSMEVQDVPSTSLLAEDGVGLLAGDGVYLVWG
jgi:hypothetical protein